MTMISQALVLVVLVALVAGHAGDHSNNAAFAPKMLMI